MNNSAVRMKVLEGVTVEICLDESGILQ